MNPQNQNSHKTLISAVVIILLVIGAFLFLRSYRVVTDTTPTSPTATTSISVATTTQQSIVEGITGTGHFKVTMLGDTPVVPDYKSIIVCQSNIPAAQCTQMQSQAVIFEQRIAKNVQDQMAWINLGTVRKVAGDYQGAIKAWQYIAKLYPTNPTAFANLADTYANFIKDYSKAETNYLTVIKLYPADTSSYTNLFTIYTTTSYKPTSTSAENILKRGITANPKAIDLQVILARYYKSLGRTADAKAQYTAAVANAQSQNNQSLATQIQQESASL